MFKYTVRVQKRRNQEQLECTPPVTTNTQREAHDVSVFLVCAVIVLLKDGIRPRVSHLEGGTQMVQYTVLAVVADLLMVLAINQFSSVQ